VKFAASLEHEGGGGEAEAMTAVPARAHPGIAPLIHRQQGVLSSRQATTHGLAHETLRQRVLRGIWQRLLPGVYALQCGPPTWQQWLIAALVYAGEGSMLTGPAALAEYGLLPASARSGHLACIDVLVPHRTRRQNVPRDQTVAGTEHALDAPTAPALRIMRATRIPEPMDSGTLRLAPPARVVVDACLAEARGGAGEAAVQAIAERALASGRVSLTDLETELARALRRHSGPLRAYLARYRQQMRAAAAERLVAAVGTAIGPYDLPLREVTVYSGHTEVARTTLLWPSRAVVAAVDAPKAEVDSLERLGFAVVQVTAQDVAGDLSGALRRIESVLRERPEATLPAGVSLLPGSQRVRTANSPARTGRSRTLPRGGIGQAS
jgi:hypothetical protein